MTESCSRQPKPPRCLTHKIFVRRPPPHPWDQFKSNELCVNLHSQWTKRVLWLMLRTPGFANFSSSSIRRPHASVCSGCSAIPPLVILYTLIIVLKFHERTNNSRERIIQTVTVGTAWLDITMISFLFTAGRHCGAKTTGSICANSPWQS